jgi:hypothetical protein
MSRKADRDTETSSEAEAERPSTRVPVPPSAILKGALKRLRKPDRQFHEGDVLENYALIALPWCEAEPRESARAAAFIERLRGCVDELMAEDEKVGIVADELFFSKDHPLSVSDRYAAAIARIGDTRIKGRKQAEYLEDKALNYLARALLAAVDMPEAFGTPRGPVPERHRGLVKRRYCCSLELDPDDARRQVAHKAVLVEATQEPQYVYIDRYYTTGSRSEPESIEELSEAGRFEWLVARPERRPNKPPTSWWFHIFNLGTLLEVGETRILQWCETYWDAERTFQPHMAAVATPGMESLSLAVRLPAEHSARSAQARIIAHPNGSRDVVREWTRSPDRYGWYIKHFTKLEPGLEYGIYFTNLRLYS